MTFTLSVWADSQYRIQGYRAILLLDFDDVVLLNQDLVAGSFARAADMTPETEQIDDVYLVDSRRAPPWVFPVQVGDDRFPQLKTFQAFFSEQYRSDTATASLSGLPNNRYWKSR